MSGWFLAAIALSPGLLAAALGCLRGPAHDRVVAMNLTGSLVTVQLLLVAGGLGPGFLFDVAVTAAAASAVTGLVYAHLLERWL